MSHATGAPTRGPEFPPTARHPVEDHYAGDVVRDDYRWLENWSDPAVQRWSNGENDFARSYLDHLHDRPSILKRVTALNLDVAPAYHDLQCRRGVVFAIKDQPPLQQPMLVRLDGLDPSRGERVLVDPNTMDKTGGTAIDFYAPSLDGAKVAVSLSQGGTESGTVIVVDARTGARLPDTVPRVNGGTAGGGVAWDAVGAGFYHTRYPAKGERPDADLDFWQQVYYHRLGTAQTDDRPVLTRELPKIAETTLVTSDDGRVTLADVRNGDGGEHAFYLLHDGGSFERVAGFADRVVSAAIGADALYLLSRAQASNGKVLRVALDHPRLAAATVVVPTGATAIEGLVATPHRLYVQDIIGGPSQVRVFSTGGEAMGMLPLPAIVGVSNIVHLDGDAVAVEIQSCTRPPYWARYDSDRRRLVTTALAMRSPADFSDVEVRREIAMSKDGTPVPMTVLMRRGTPLDGRAIALLTGYGGFGISQRPGFNPIRSMWLDQGGIVAIANIRGGSEFGENWHRGGNLTRKQNVFDDFAAAAEHLVEKGYTTSEHLALQGGSNGGLLMGAIVTQHPDLARAVVSSVGIYDMLRVELSPNGLFNTTEYGTVRHHDEYEALRAYSPYHHVVDGAHYPAVLFTTGANDPRVDPMHSRKMVARLQAATGSDCPILLRTSAHAGHGIGSPLSERNALTTDTYAFLFDRLGVRFQSPATRPAP
ncbi:MAG: S9 family peptidase [Candidatus Eisenbacteria bacterium]|nr:S9 family peptidase [Candidatus Eisenbacteria bacterium]